MARKTPPKKNSSKQLTHGKTGRGRPPGAKNKATLKREGKTFSWKHFEGEAKGQTRNAALYEALVRDDSYFSARLLHEGDLVNQKAQAHERIISDSAVFYRMVCPCSHFSYSSGRRESPPLATSWLVGILRSDRSWIEDSLLHI